MSLLWRAVAAEPAAAPWSSTLRGREEWLSFSSRLPSLDKGLWFTAAFELALRVSGRSRLRRQAAAGSARAEILEFAWKVAEGYSVADFGIAEADLSRKLIEEDVVSDSEITFGSVAVRLTADSEDVELVKERERWAPRSAIRAEEHRAQMEHLQRLTEDVYSDPAVALRWWYDRNPDGTEKLAAAKDNLRLVMSNAAEDQSVADAAGLLSELLRDLESADREFVLERLALLFAGFGRRDLARRVRDRAGGENVGWGIDATQ
ncbi:hypothetical protein [Streptomonospora arabica]|uniref:Uncharacterized protein n=1 Tax=Streptomonospora arabica TaxID=412417 RepID=A0ABV9SQ67_9ACTN